jgi:aminoglycoside 6'-N-acetyltransferase I
MANGAKIVAINPEDNRLIDNLAQLTYEAFKLHAPSWLPTLADARRQVLKSIVPDRICRVLIGSNDEPVGWVGVIPIHHGRIWEIHPLAVSVREQGKGYGRILVTEVQQLAERQGVLGLVAGTSHETGATSLYGIDLYDDPLEALKTLTCGTHHPLGFWMRIGFTVVGVMPDVDGRGKPGISLAKRIG